MQPPTPSPLSQPTKSCPRGINSKRNDVFPRTHCFPCVAPKRIGSGNDCTRAPARVASVRSTRPSIRPSILPSIHPSFRLSVAEGLQPREQGFVKMASTVILRDYGLLASVLNHKSAKVCPRTLFAIPGPDTFTIFQNPGWPDIQNTEETLPPTPWVNHPLWHARAAMLTVMSVQPKISPCPRPCSLRS